MEIQGKFIDHLHGLILIVPAAFTVILRNLQLKKVKKSDKKQQKGFSRRKVGTSLKYSRSLT